MENRKASSIRAIERVLTSEKLTKRQIKTLGAFDRFNELEVQTELSTRKSYLENLNHLGVNVGKPFEKMTKEDRKVQVSASMRVTKLRLPKKLEQFGGNTTIFAMNSEGVLKRKKGINTSGRGKEKRRVRFCIRNKGSIESLKTF